MKKYIVEIERNAEIRTDGTYQTPDEIVNMVMFVDGNGAGENYEKIALTDNIEVARRIFNENKKSCSSKQGGRKITADVLRIREINFDDEGNELDPDGMDILDTYVAMIDGYVLSENHRAVDFDLATTYMDDEIREELHTQLAPCEDQTFFIAYEKKHWEKYNESFAKSYDIEH